MGADWNPHFLHLLDGLGLQCPLALCLVVLILRVMHLFQTTACDWKCEFARQGAQNQSKGTVATCRRCLSVCTDSCSASTIVSSLRTCMREYDGYLVVSNTHVNNAHGC